MMTSSDPRTNHFARLPLAGSFFHSWKFVVQLLGQSSSWPVRILDQLIKGLFNICFAHLNDMPGK